MLRPLSRLPVKLRVGAAAVVNNNNNRFIITVIGPVVDPGEPGQHRRGGARIAADGEAVGEVNTSSSFTLTTLNKT